MNRSTALESAVDDVTRQIRVHGLELVEFSFIGMVDGLMESYPDVPRDEMETAARAAIKAFRTREIANWGRESPICYPHGGNH